eukprot:9498171-Pyramimonas_sp.AAC.1
MAPHWPLSRQCWRNDEHNFINGIISCRPCLVVVAKPALGAVACPAPLSPGLPGQKQNSPKFLTVTSSADGGDYWDTSK